MTNRGLKPFVLAVHVQLLELALGFCEVDDSLDDRDYPNHPRNQAEREHTANQAQRKQDKALGVVPQVELVYAEAAQENSQQSRSNVIARRERRCIMRLYRRLLVRPLSRGGRLPVGALSGA